MTVVTLFGWMAAVTLPEGLSRAARELAAGQTASMDRLLLALAVLWLVVLAENLNVSLSSDRLRRFPLDVRSLLALRLLSIFLSPIAWLAAIVSLAGLSPLLSSHHPLLGSLAALWFLALTIGVGLSVSRSVGIARWRRTSLAAAAALGVVAVAFALASRLGAPLPRAVTFMGANPAIVVTTAAVATTSGAIAVSVATLSVSGAAVSYLLLLTFRRSLQRDSAERAARRAGSIGRLPGRLGPLVAKELRAITRVLDLWMGLLLMLAAAALSLATSPTATVRQAVFVIAYALNANVTLNCLGLDRPAGLTRYLILPLRGTDLLLAKNAALAVALAVQLIPLLAIGAWQSGVMQVGADIVVAIVLLLAHVAWGNVVSVFEPRRTDPYRFASTGDPVTTSVSAIIGSAPGVAVILLLHSDSRVASLAIAMIVLLTIAAYYGSLRLAGSSFERRIESISQRLA